MKLKNKKSVLIMIIVLMVVIIPSGIYGTVAHFNHNNISNPNNDFYHNGKLFFYAKGSNTLLGTYTCNKKICDYAYETMDDKNLDINIYDDDKIDKIELVNNKYAFIVDEDNSNINDYYKGASITIYDIINSNLKMTIKAVKNYSIGIENNLYIVSNAQNKWGVIRIGDDVLAAIPYNYDYIGLANHVGENKLLSSRSFIVKDDKGYKLIDSSNNSLSSSFENIIYDYNDNYITTKNNNLYYLNKYDGNKVVPYAFNYINYYGNFIGVININKDFYIIDPITGLDKTKRYPVNSIDDVNCTLNDGNLTISINGENKETISSYEEINNINEEGL